MRSVALFTDEIDDLELAVEDLSRQLGNFILGRSSAGLVFVHPDADMQELATRLQQVFAIPIIGATAAFIFTMYGVKREGISLHIFTGDDCEFALDCTGEISAENYQDEVAGLYNRLLAYGDTPRIMLAYGNPAPGLVAEDYLAELDAVSQRVPVFGGMASDCFELENCQIFARNKVVKYGLAAIAIKGNVKPVAMGSFKVGTALEYEGRVTKVEGNKVMELDGMPFAEAIAKAGVIMNQEDDSVDYLNIPFKIKSWDEHGRQQEYLRHLMDIDYETGGATFFGRIPLGAKVQVGFLSREYIKESVEEVVQHVLEEFTQDPQAYSSLLISSCASRAMGYANAVDDESYAYVKMIPQNMAMSGFYAYGEIYPVSVEGTRELVNSFHNTTFTLLMI